MNIRIFAREYFFSVSFHDLMKTMCLFDNVDSNHLNTQISRIFHWNNVQDAALNIANPLECNMFIYRTTLSLLYLFDICVFVCVCV